MRLQNFANEEFGSTGFWAGFGTRFSKPIGINETKEMLVEKFDGVPIKKTYTCNPAGVRLSRSGAKQAPRADALRAEERQGQPAWAPRRCQYGKVRIFIEGAGEEMQAATAFLGEDWGKFTPIDDEMRLYLGVAQDIVVKRTIEKNESKRIAGNLYDQEVVVKYEIENFKDQPVTLDVVENLRHIRNEVRGDTGRDVAMGTGQATRPSKAAPTRRRARSSRSMFHVKLPARDTDGKAEKVVQKLHVILKNEW